MLVRVLLHLENSKVVAWAGAADISIDRRGTTLACRVNVGNCIEL